MDFILVKMESMNLKKFKVTLYTKVGQSSMNPVQDFKSKIWSNKDVFQRSISSLNFNLEPEISKLV